MSEYRALIQVAGVDLGDHSYSIMKSDSGRNYIHINNHKTNTNSVITRYEEAKKAFELMDMQLNRPTTGSTK